MKSVCRMRMHSLNSSIMPMDGVDDLDGRQQAGETKAILKPTDRPKSPRLSLAVSRLEVDKARPPSANNNSNHQAAVAVENKTVEDGLVIDTGELKQSETDWHRLPRIDRTNL